jgi:hypothetical protein
MKNHLNYSYFKTEIIIIVKNIISNIFLPTSYQFLNCKSNISRLFISFLFAKQNNLLSSINYLNQPKGTILRLKNEIEITII